MASDFITAPNGYPGVPPSYPGGFSQPPQMNANWGAPPMGYPAGPPPSAGGYPSGPAQASGYPSGPPQASGYPSGPPQASGYPSVPPQSNGGGYPDGAAGGYPAWGNPSYQQQGAGGYPNLPSAGMGFGGPSAPGQSIFSLLSQSYTQCLIIFFVFKDPKETEAAQSAYYDPNQPQTAYVAPPPAYYVSKSILPILR